MDLANYKLFVDERTAKHVIHVLVILKVQCYHDEHAPNSDWRNVIDPQHLVRQYNVYYKFHIKY